MNRFSAIQGLLLVPGHAAFYVVRIGDCDVHFEPRGGKVVSKLYPDDNPMFEAEFEEKEGKLNAGYRYTGLLSTAGYVVEVFSWLKVEV